MRNILKCLGLLIVLQSRGLLSTMPVLEAKKNCFPTSKSVAAIDVSGLHLLANVIIQQEKDEYLKKAMAACVPNMQRTKKRKAQKVYDSLSPNYKPQQYIDYCWVFDKQMRKVCMCCHCNKILRGLTSIKRHINVHVRTVKKKYACYHCGRRYMQSSHQYDHERRCLRSHKIKQEALD